MMKHVLTQFPWPWLPATALLIFFTFFILLLIRLGQKHRQPILREASLLPLDEGQKHE